MSAVSEQGESGDQMAVGPLVDTEEEVMKQSDSCPSNVPYMELSKYAGIGTGGFIGI
jgi:hypothetical protein